MPNTTERIICPLCGLECPHRERGEVNKTNLWICHYCPFIGFEYFSKKDIENLLLKNNE